MDKRGIVLAAVAAGVIGLGSCKGGKSEAAGSGKAAEDSTAVTTEELSEATAEKAETTEAGAGKDGGEFPSTFEQPEGRVLELLKDYNARMDDYNAKGLTALGMGFQQNRVLLNYTVDDDLYDLRHRERLTQQAREMIRALKMSERAAWRCIPDEGHTLMMTFVGKRSGKIVSVVFTPEELRELL